MVDSKLDLLAKELRLYGIAIAAIQETKWFGSDVWQSDGYTLLHSGRPLPGDEESGIRNEGVGIMLDENASAAWKEAGEAWEAVSSRIFTAQLKTMSRGKRRPGGGRETRNSYISVISVYADYAPTARAPPGVKGKFPYELQDTIDKVSQSDVLLLLGDFNAQVGYNDGQWSGIMERHGIGTRNEARESLLEFCAVNQLTIVIHSLQRNTNTWLRGSTQPLKRHT